MILNLLKSAAAGMLLHACAALAFGPHAAETTPATDAGGMAAAPPACLQSHAIAAPAYLPLNLIPVSAHED
ncbi:MAG: hypothetical protein ACO1PZ_14355 [Gammaproteobacteria bacterium]